jgi:hypothetical protein
MIVTPSSRGPHPLALGDSPSPRRQRRREPAVDVDVYVSQAASAKSARQGRESPDRERLTAPRGNDLDASPCAGAPTVLGPLPRARGVCSSGSRRVRRRSVSTRPRWRDLRCRRVRPTLAAAAAVAPIRLRTFASIRASRSCAPSYPLARIEGRIVGMTSSPGSLPATGILHADLSSERSWAQC